MTSGCTETRFGLRCTRPANHGGLHTVAGRTWGFRSPDDSGWVAARLAKVLAR